MKSIDQSIFSIRLAAPIFLLCTALLSACGGGSSSTSTPAASSGAAVGPTRAAGCPSAATNLSLSCSQVGGTPASSAQYTAIIGSYGPTTGDQLYVGNSGAVYYGLSPTAYTPAGGICQGSASNTVVMYFNNASNSRLIFTIGSTDVQVTGNVPNAANTQLTNAVQSSCQY